MKIGIVGSGDVHGLQKRMTEKQERLPLFRTTLK